jgi:hypothetical protein
VPERTAPAPGRSGRRDPVERSPEMTTLTIAAKYTRYLLTSLVTIAFGLALN